MKEVDKLKRLGRYLINWMISVDSWRNPSKSNAQAARCTGGVNVNGRDRISSAP